MRNKAADIAVAMLCGGKNSRMDGRNKALIKIGGIPLIERTVKPLKEVFEEIIIVTNSPQDFKSYAGKALITQDIIKNSGPLGGMHGALSVTSKQAVFFVACDMPFLHNALIERQMEEFRKISCDCLIPRVNGCAEPLHAVYRKALKNKIYIFIKESLDYSIRSFLKTVDVRYWDLENSCFNRRVFLNLNTKEDLRRARHEDKV